VRTTRNHPQPEKNRMATASLASLRQPAAETLDASALFQQLLAQPMRGGFDPDAWHVMQERDNELIRSEPRPKK
jgi:hypothetical protein